MSADNDEFTDAEKAAIARGLAVAADHRAPLRIVHDPDTGCFGCAVSDEDLAGEPWYCNAKDQALPDENKGRYATNPVPAPPWCPLRAGDVVVSAKKDGDT